jgi:class 3 adenylate cyclase
MSLKDDLEQAVKGIFKSTWTERDGTVVPDADTVKLTNDAVKLTGTVLYADMADSTKMVDNSPTWRSAESYKAFLHCAAKIIRHEGGTISAYDGDRIMAVFLGDNKNTSAVRAAMKIRWASLNIINPAKTNQYSDDTYPVKQAIGIDTSSLFVANTGVRGAKDLVWWDVLRITQPSSRRFRRVTSTSPRTSTSASPLKESYRTEWICGRQ